MNDGAIELCNSTSGICDCEDGYKGDKCKECDAGYYNTGTNEAPMCSGKWKEIITSIYNFIKLIHTILELYFYYLRLWMHY